MDERTRRDSESGTTSNSPHESKFKEWDYSENISSKSDVEKINPTAKTPGRFEVHIPESDDFPVYRENPTRVPAPVNRPSQASGKPPRPSSAMPGQPAMRGQNSNANRPVRPKPASELNVPSKNTRTASGVGPTKSTAGGAKARSTGKSASASMKKPQVSKTEAPKKKKKVMSNADRAYNLAKGILVTCVCFIFIATLTTVACSVAFGFINDILVLDDENKGYSVVVEIPEGATYETIFDILTDNGLVSQPLLTNFFCKFRHYDTYTVYDEETGEPAVDPETGKTQKAPVEYVPGVYYLSADSGIENILDSMLANNSVNKGTVRLTFPEGWTIAEIFDKIEKYDVCEAKKLYANLEIVANEYSFIKKIKDTEGRYLKAEGYLFPDTYDFYIGESANSVLKKLLTNFEVKWEKEYNDRLKELGMSVDDVIKIASIIQCEAKDGSQMADISGVIHNRLNNSADHPHLGMDSTFYYIDVLKSLNIFANDEQYDFYYKSYSTYTNTGLPPGPICNPSSSAIRAALYPTEHDYFYFCHGEDGTVYFAKTYSEHQKNEQIAIYGGVGGF